MNKAITLMNLSIAITLLLIVPAQAQRSLDPNGPGDTCSGPVFSAKEITRPARIISRNIPNMTPEALAHDVHGRVKLEAVLCRNGSVTDVRVLEGLPYGMTAKAVESVLTTRFGPAEMNWHSVSQRMQFEFHFNDDSNSDEIALERADGRLIESIMVIGNRRLTSEQIMKWISTRAGDICDNLQVRRDLEAILKTGYFDKPQSRVFAEQGARGGVGIIFEIYELPLISAVKFAGLKYVSEKVILDVLLKEKIDLRKGAVYDPEKIQNARRTISKVLQLNGQRDATVELHLEYITGFTVALTVVVSGTN